MTWDLAVETLFRAPHGAFVTERKRLAAELKAAGDKAGATKLGKLGRPPVSAWALNQCWWRARPAFEAFLASAAALRGGDFSVLPAHKANTQALLAQVSAFLKEIGNAAQDGTVRRAEITLTALAATGTFEPDAPGQLSDDRDPAGFLALGIATGPTAAPSAPSAPVIPLPVAAPPAAPPPETRAEEEAAHRAAALAERAAREHAHAEQQRREAEHRAALEALNEAEAELARLEAETAEARKRVLTARTRVAELG